MLSKIPCGSPSTNSNLQLLIDSFFTYLLRQHMRLFLKEKKTNKKWTENKPLSEKLELCTISDQNEQNYILSVSSMTLEYQYYHYHYHLVISTMAITNSTLCKEVSFFFISLISFSKSHICHLILEFQKSRFSDFTI